MATESFWIYLIILFIILIISACVWIIVELTKLKRSEEKLSKLKKADLKLIA